VSPATAKLWQTLIAAFKGVTKALEVWLKESQDEEKTN
jgi:hypothetical protein